ncbi:GNAT family N-acetyltransferase [Hymenobacter wooponensis]|uniref:N-acetyltransferase n=1 Tax=Hymenobacter wooponensis TaxID=1525360 RepID=A0A4Z0MD65_9BACT|nr:GNAT family protein [Hymenobacter wooponensis]TGD77683.1 N-acetyltransferase [Hymenobacter wooponensis]
MMDMPRFSVSYGRIRLRPLLPTDHPSFATYRADPQVARYQGFAPYTAADAAAFIEANAQTPIPPEPGQWVQLALTRAADGVLLGDCALHRQAAEPRFGEFGITLAPAWQGQGYAREAVLALLGYCFEELVLHRVLALTDVRNQGCVHLLESVGMRREAHFQHNGWYKGEWCDELQYALLATEWAQRSTPASPDEKIGAPNP